MTRARAFVGAVPQRVWTAVAGLALLASLAVAAVIGAGLSVWRSAVGSSAQPPTTVIEPPSSGLVVLPGAPAGAHPHRPAAHPRHPVPQVVVPVRTVPAVRSGGRAPTPVHARPVAARAVPVPVAFTPRLILANANGDGFNLARESEPVAAATKFVAHVRHEPVVRARHAAEKHARPRHKAHQHRAPKHKAHKHHTHRDD